MYKSTTVTTPPLLSASVRTKDGMIVLASIVQLFHRVGKELLLEGQADMVAPINYL